IAESRLAPASGVPAKNVGVLRIGRRPGANQTEASQIVQRKEHSMITDQQGNSLSGATPEAARLFDEALTGFNSFSGDPAALLGRAIESAPGFGMAHAFLAW